MTRKRRRLYLLLGGMLGLGLAAGLVLYAFRDNLVFFYSPTEAIEKHVAAGTHIRIGGLVEKGSVEKDGDHIAFRITDLKNTLPVTYTGALPDLFREDQGVVAEGALTESGVFAATQILAKHDETYMPPEVAAALKKSGRWQETEGQGTKGQETEGTAQ